MDYKYAIRTEGYRRRYSPRTIKTYQKAVERFLRFVGKEIDKISKKDAREFLEYLSNKGLAGSTLNVYHMAVRFFLEEILNKRMRLNITYSKVPVRLPVVLSKEEIKLIINNIKNLKHKLMIGLIYGGGLRVSELLSLKVCDLFLDKNYGYVRNGKGGKDRIFVISKKLKNAIEMLILEEDLKDWHYLLTSNRGRKYSVRTIQTIIKKAVKKAKIKKRVSPHTFRHSFATHLIEQGYDISQVQAALGHKSPETTFIYLHTSPKMINITSPYDLL